MEVLQPGGPLYQQDNILAEDFFLGTRIFLRSRPLSSVSTRLISSLQNVYSQCFLRSYKQLLQEGNFLLAGTQSGKEFTTPLHLVET
jgi:hypothetical protein